ncbi:hypothetical protein K432DRAFT_376921 [Lepidopterella palustris CBS 459.81]|uniref:Uncharacterized protein n=1 Tax=Lepidopterella palustris CBS 459.81 TaxID=1314670 RepID=A0A8E2JKY8_9PEZI|nr:hypothetical protein K432DRAFT_376921 [Lepidopterella palustris CBS 459.81]
MELSVSDTLPSAPSMRKRNLLLASPGTLGSYLVHQSNPQIPPKLREPAHHNSIRSPLRQLVTAGLSLFSIQAG